MGDLIEFGFLVRLFNACVILGKFPEKGKNAEVFLLYLARMVNRLQLIGLFVFCQ